MRQHLNFTSDQGALNSAAQLLNSTARRVGALLSQGEDVARHATSAASAVTAADASAELGMTSAPFHLTHDRLLVLGAVLFVVGAASVLSCFLMRWESGPSVARRSSGAADRPEDMTDGRSQCFSSLSSVVGELPAPQVILVEDIAGGPVSRGLGHLGAEESHCFLGRPSASSAVDGNFLGRASASSAVDGIASLAPPVSPLPTVGTQVSTMLTIGGNVERKSEIFRGAASELMNIFEKVHRRRNPNGTPVEQPEPTASRMRAAKNWQGAAVKAAASANLEAEAEDSDSESSEDEPERGGG